MVIIILNSPPIQSTKHRRPHPLIAGTTINMWSMNRIKELALTDDNEVSSTIFESVRKRKIEDLLLYYSSI